MKTQILNNAQSLGQNNMAANVLILPGMTLQGGYNVIIAETTHGIDVLTYVRCMPRTGADIRAKHTHTHNLK